MKVNMPLLFQFTCSCLHIQITETKSSLCGLHSRVAPIASLTTFCMIVFAFCGREQASPHTSHAVGSLHADKQANANGSMDHIKILNAGEQRPWKNSVIVERKYFSRLAGLSKKGRTRRPQDGTVHGSCAAMARTAPSLIIRDICLPFQLLYLFTCPKNAPKTPKISAYLTCLNGKILEKA